MMRVLPLRETLDLIVNCIEELKRSVPTVN